VNIEVIRKNKLGIYGVSQSSNEANTSSNGAIHIIIPRDLHIGNIDYENVRIGDIIEAELKISKFQMDDPYITSSGIFIKNISAMSTSEEVPSLNEDKQEKIVQPAIEQLDDEDDTGIESDAIDEEEDEEDVEGDEGIEIDIE
jgi:exosome complex RNA-binding protein Csl4